MKHKTTKAIIGSLVSALMLMTSAAFAMPASAEHIVWEDFNETPIVLPWVPVSSQPAMQDFCVQDGRLEIKILNNRGPEGRWDLQLRRRGLTMIQGHEYTVKCTITADDDGYIYSKIGNYTGEKEYWHNLGGQEWMPYHITKGETYEFEDTFVLKDSPVGPTEWSFMYADNQGMYNNNDTGMPDGSTITFDDLELIDNTGSGGCGYYLRSDEELYGLVRPHSNVRVNQIGYYTNLSKTASYCTDDYHPCEFELRDAEGKTVYTGTASSVMEANESGIGETKITKYGTQLKDSGKYVQTLDFSDFNETGDYTIFVKDKTGVSGTCYYAKEGFYDTKLKEDKLIWTDDIGQEYCMNESPVISIKDDVYGNGLLADSLNYFYQNRSSVDIEKKYITSGDKDSPSLAHAAGNTEDIGYVQHNWVKYYPTYAKDFDGDKDYPLDVTGGWYDADSHCKSVINGAYSVWKLQNAYELSKSLGKSDKFSDNNLAAFPEGDNGAPDILDEARYELEWMQKMIVDKADPHWGDTCEGMLYHKVQDHKWISLPEKPWDYINEYGMVRIIKPPTYAATLDYAACAAQAARLWKDYDPEFAEKCLETAKKAYNAVMQAAPERQNVYDNADRTNPLYAPYDQAIGAQAYDDDRISDEFYWADCELYISTGDEGYYNDLAAYKNDNDASGMDKAFSISDAISKSYTSFDVYNTSAFGNMSFVLNKDILNKEDYSRLESSFKTMADNYVGTMTASDIDMNVPFKGSVFCNPSSIATDTFDDDVDGYQPYSNEYIINNATILAYAYKLTGDNSYLDKAVSGMDYIFGKNGLGLSYVTGYGSQTAQNPHHRYWGNWVDPDYPKAPDGVLVSGANSQFGDEYMKLLGIKKGVNAPQKCYVDSYDAWSVNAADLQLNADLVSIVSMLQDMSDGSVKSTPAETSPVSTTTVNTTTSAATTKANETTAQETTTTAPVNTTSDENGVIYGDANGDESVDISDAVIIMQALSNPSVYGEKGTAENHLNEKTKKNADCNLHGDGITNKDALSIQKYLLKLIDKLPESYQ